MSIWWRKAVYLAAVLILATVAVAQKTSLRLPADNPVSQIKPGPGDDAVRRDCGFCHSTDYIVTQPRLAAQQWDGEVRKMIAVYGAPINSADAKAISDYLAKEYGSDSAESKRTSASKP